MIITKKQSKQLRYYARSNCKSLCQGTDTPEGKVKHRDFPVSALSYDERKAGSDIELSNITLHGNPFDGTFAELMDWLQGTHVTAVTEPLKNNGPIQTTVHPVEQHYEPCLLHGPDCTQEPLPPGPPIVQPIAKPQEEPEHLFGPMSHRGFVGDALNFFKNVKLVDREPQAAENLPKESASVADIPEEVKENVLEVAETVTTLVHPEMKVLKSEIKDLSEDGTLTIAVQSVISNSVDKVNVEIKPVGDHVEINPVAEIPAEPASKADSVSDPSGELTGMVNPTWSSGEENVEPLNAIHVEATAEKIHKDFETAVKEAKETGTPVVTAVQKPTIHVDSAADGTPNVCATVDTQEPPKLSLHDAYVKCTVMRLAKELGEPLDTTLPDILSRYTDALDRYTAIQDRDGLSLRTLTEEKLLEAYPEEYAVIKGNI